MNLGWYGSSMRILPQRLKNSATAAENGTRWLLHLLAARLQQSIIHLLNPSNHFSILSHNFRFCIRNSKLVEKGQNFQFLSQNKSKNGQNFRLSIQN